MVVRTWEKMGSGVKARQRKYKCVELPPYLDNIIGVSDSKSHVILALTTFLELAFLLEKLGFLSYCL